MLRILAVVMIHGLLLCSAINTYAEETETAAIFFESLQKGNYDAAANCLAPEYRVAYPASALKITWDSLTNQIGPPH